MLRIFKFFNYIQGITVLAIICLIAYVWVININIGLQIFLTIIITFITVIIKVAFDNDLDTDNLWKYYCRFYIDSFSINDKTYYIPVIKVLTTWGNYYEYVLSRNGSVNETSPYEIKRALNRNSNDRIIRYCFSSEADALYAISQSQNKINKVKQTKNTISNNKRINVNFKKA